MIDSGFLYPPPPFGCEDYFRQDRRWCKLRNSDNCPSKHHFVRILRAWYPNVHLQRETCCGSQNSLQQLARKFANVFLCRRRFICNHSGFNAVYVEPRWRPSTVDSEQLWEALTQGGFEAGSEFYFWIEWFYFGTASALLTMKSFTKGLLNAIDDMCFDMFCVCKTLWNCVTKPQTCVWEQMASLGKSLEEWISWLFRVHVKVQTGCPPEREREREKTHAKTPKSAFLVSLQVATASPKETIWICNVWFIVNQPNQFKTLYWWLKSWWRESCFAEGCLWSAWLPLNFAWHRCQASNAANTLQYFAFLGRTARSKGHG